MSISSIIKERNNEFLKLCQTHKVSKMYAFGSGVTDQFDPIKSDLDFVVDLNITDPIEYGDTLLSFWDKLEILFRRKVDLLTDDSIRNPYLKKSIDATKKLIYDRQGEKIFV